MGEQKTIRIVPARAPEQIEDVRIMFRLYFDWLARDYGIRLDFQGAEDELRELPGKYAPPAGELLIAYDDHEQPLGCIAVRAFHGQTCEIKRLFLLPAARGKGLGHRLCDLILAEARRLGYTRAVLDTGGFMGAAQRIYEQAGFTNIPAYYENPLPDIRYFGRDL